MGFVVQVSGFLPPHTLDREGRVFRQTVLQATVRDQAALYGFLKVLHDLGLELVDLRHLPASEGRAGTEAGSLSKHGDSLTVEVVIHGSIGDLVVSAVCDHVEVTHLSTRLVLSDRQLLGQVLDWARSADADVEYAVDAPPLTDPSGTPAAPPRSAPSSSRVVDETTAE
jgi:hypothetical protein